MAKILPNNILKSNGKTVRKLEADDQKIESQMYHDDLISDIDEIVQQQEEIESFQRSIKKKEHFYLSKEIGKFSSTKSEVGFVQVVKKYVVGDDDCQML